MSDKTNVTIIVALTRHAAAFTSCLLSWTEAWAHKVWHISLGEK